MFAKTFKSALLATLIAATAMPALANGHRVHVEQFGWNNQVGGGQSGHRQRLTVIQSGGANLAIATQDGRRNEAAVGQSGYYNSADVDQWGRRNVAGVSQMGNNNDAEVVQHGRRNVSAVIQMGDNNDASVQQYGSNNVVAIVHSPSEFSWVAQGVVAWRCGGGSAVDGTTRCVGESGTSGCECGRCIGSWWCRRLGLC